MRGRNSDKEWEKLGRDDPYFGVIDMPCLRNDQIDEDGRLAFFASGAKHIDGVLETIREMSPEGVELRRALDFGCGVGRCTLPLAERLEHVTGVDVSNSMLHEARINADKRGIENATWLNPGSDISALDGTFDLIHSVLVFQHIPVVRGMEIVRQMIERLSDGGFANLHFLYYRDVSTAASIVGWMRKHIPGAHGLVNLAHSKPFSEPLMEKNCYDVNALLYLLHTHGCGNIRVQLHSTGTLKMAAFFFQKQSSI
jgi:SAM-dependent methyltransferase